MVVRPLGRTKRMDTDGYQQSSYTKLPIWVTATCDFTRFDDVNTSAGESVFLNANSGGYRIVYDNPCRVLR